VMITSSMLILAFEETVWCKSGHNLVSDRSNHKVKLHRTGKLVFAGVATLNCRNRIKKSRDGLMRVGDRTNQPNRQLICYSRPPSFPSYAKLKTNQQRARWILGQIDLEADSGAGRSQGPRGSRSRGDSVSSHAKIGLGVERRSCSELLIDAKQVVIPSF
jgi:hypothetical protein